MRFKTPRCSVALSTLQLFLLILQGKIICKSCKTNLSFSFYWVAALTFTCHGNFSLFLVNFCTLILWLLYCLKESLNEFIIIPFGLKDQALYSRPSWCSLHSARLLCCLLITRTCLTYQDHWVTIADVLLSVSETRCGSHLSSFLHWSCFVKQTPEVPFLFGCWKLLLVLPL